MHPKEEREAHLTGPPGWPPADSRGSSRVVRTRDYDGAIVANREPERLTHAEKEQLEAELAELEGPRRTDVVEAIASARGFGDLSENFEYHAAKNEQGLLERRIRVVRDRLNRAELIDEEAAAASDRIEVGSRVELEDEHGERIAIEISSVGGVSADSPA